ncbi:hypothetical protein [Paenibacillus kobensis]|uniref:hypothetical protein n=1 Tax=Paenibacillus kobensis TaxID=59841 RepID=UPI000FD7D06E|nr:hypothetical protein [Paenibacillus kobensis]
MRSILSLMLLSFVLMVAAAGCGIRLHSVKNTGNAESGVPLSSSQTASGEDAVSSEPSIVLPEADDAQALSRHGGPAPRYVSFYIEPEYSDYKTGETIVFRIKLTNEWEKELHIGNEPKLRVGPAMSDTGSLDEIAVPALANLSLEPGKSLNTTAEWKQRGKSGQYRVEIGDVDLGLVRTSSGGTTFFVKDPEEPMLVRAVDGSGEITLPNSQIEEKSTIVMKHIEFTDHETAIQFDIHTKQMAPLGFNVSLIRDDNKEDAERALSVEQSDQIDGIITAKVTFNPTSLGTKRLKLVFSNWNVVHTGEGVETIDGPWSIELPLN